MAGSSGVRRAFSGDAVRARREERRRAREAEQAVDNRVKQQVLEALKKAKENTVPQKAIRNAQETVAAIKPGS